MNDTHTGRMVELAKMGFNIVPRFISHPEHGVCSLLMDGVGIRVCALNGDWEKSSTWEKME